MFTQTFRAGQAPQVMLVECTGALIVESWDERQIAVEAETRLESVELEGEALVIKQAHGDLLLHVPADTTIAVANQHGDVTAHGMHALAIERVEGSVRVEAIGGEARLRDIYGKTRADDVESLLIERDTQPRQQHLWKGLRRDIEITNTRTVEIAEATDNLTIVAARRVAAGPVGGNAIVHEIAGDLRLGAIGGNCTVERVAGGVRVGTIGGNADLRAAGAVLQIGDVGGNLTLNGAPPVVAGGTKDISRLVVGGNARLEFPADANLTIHATIGGVIRGEGINSTFAGGTATIDYGEGAGHLGMIVGGNLELYGGTPKISSSFWGSPAWPGPAKRRRVPEPSRAREFRDAAPGPGIADERIAILKMVAAGRISTEEAERRLDTLGG